jgi:transcriptional regulator with XRE-family HTH domain
VIDPGSIDRRSARTKLGRRAETVRRAIGQQIVQQRLDANVSQRRLAQAAGIPQGYLSRIEAGATEPSIGVLLAIGEALGADLTFQLRPGTGPRIRDRHQAAIVEALLDASRETWQRAVEVPVWRPVRGVIDLVLARPEVVVAAEVHSEIRRLEQQLRWAAEKAASLPSAREWSLLSGDNPSVTISSLLVLRWTRTNRELVRTFRETFGARYPARSETAVAALRDPTIEWPAPALVWARIDGGTVRLLDAEPDRVRRSA